MLADLAAQTHYTPFRLPVQAAWQMRQAGKPDWQPAQVPGSVHTILLKNGQIEDPFYRDNEEKLQWIEREDWEWQGTFTVQDVALKRKHIEMIFKGLDTYAHVYLNDSLILETDNQFRTWTADVKKHLHAGENKLHIYFESPLKKTETDWKNLGYELPGGQRVASRKAQFHYGWDWGPRFVGCGILKVPELLAWDDFLIENIFVTAQDINPERAKMVARIRYRSDIKAAASFTARYEKRKSVENRTIYAGVQEDSVTWEVEKPKLWWPHGMGEPNLYDFSIEIKSNSRLLEKAEVRAGIRTIELVTEKDASGESFYFKVNGKPVFAKGANYIPQDIFQDRVTGGHYKRLLDDAVAANMNMIRVWGGGIYEDDVFYQLCDARGLLVWQDFMYACALYPGNGKFLKTAAAEALEQIERLRQHPCIALWCGNNENNEAWHHWGWQMQFNEAQRNQLWRDYQIMFNDLLPTYVSNNGGGVPYWESSPKYGRANPKSTAEGDSHYWGVWIDEKPIEIYNSKVPRFMSEYGFQSFPDWRTIQSYTLPEDRELDSKVMLIHQKFPRGNALMAEYMRRDYPSIPKSFEDFTYLSQVVQAEAIRTGIEAHRRNKPYCMGTLYWQLNDVWPVASWSGIDCFGRWKALHYYAREAFAPVAALPIMEGDTLRIYGVCDLGDTATATLHVRSLSFEGKTGSDIHLPDLVLRPDSAHVIWQESLKTLLNGIKTENAVVEITLHDTTGKLLHRRLLYLAPPRKLDLPKAKISLAAAPAEGGYALTLSSERLAKNVLLSTDADGFFSDNYFDLLPGETKQVFFKTAQKWDDMAGAFRVKSLGEVVD